MKRPNLALLIVLSFLAGLLAGTRLEKVAFGKANRYTVPLDSAAGAMRPLLRQQNKLSVSKNLTPVELYLDLMKSALMDLIYENNPTVFSLRVSGRDRGGRGLTLIGMKRLDNIALLMNDVLQRHIPGDFIEAGAWRGGATIFMRAVLKAQGITDRRVWVADSFEGLPPPDEKAYPADKGMALNKDNLFAVSLQDVQDNFARFGLLDAQVRFLKGWFKDTLPNAPIDKLAVLRVDADMYESTMEALVSLYPKLSPGGYVIIDDFGCFEACAKAVKDFREKHGIRAPIISIDWTGAYWQK